jgi:hypothetical protein
MRLKGDESDRSEVTRRSARHGTHCLGHRGRPPARGGFGYVTDPTRIEPLDDGRRSRITFTLDFEGHGIGVALLPLVRRQTRKGAPVSYQNLKRLLETGQSSSARS